MSIFVNCSCGTKLRVDDSAAGKTVTCPKCKRPVKVSPTVAVTTAPAAKPTSDDTTTMKCGCGQPMKVAKTHAGKTVQCPKCNTKLVVPGSAPVPVAPVVKPIQPAAPAQPVAPTRQAIPVQPVTTQPVVPVQSVTPVQPVAPTQPAAQPLPDFFSSAGSSTVGLQPYTPPSVAARAGRGTPKTASKPGSLVAMIGLCVLAGGLAFTFIGQAAMHLMVYRASAGQSILGRGATMEERREAIERLRNQTETIQTIQNVMKVTLKVGRTVAVLGTITAAVGYGMCIMSPGAQMGMAIGALFAAAIAVILDLIYRVVPYLTDEGIPGDLIFVRSNIFRPGSAADDLVPLILELLLGTHLLLFSIYCLIGFGRKKKAGSGTPITAITMSAIYMGLVLVVVIMMGSTGFRSKGMLFTIFGIHWVANICLAIGIGFLIFSLTELRSAKK